MINQREILFRAKREMDGEWCYGNLCQFCYPSGEALKIELSIQEVADQNDDSIGFYHHEIRIETIGQYTGKRDLSGKRIFEGDILKDVELEHFYHVIWNNYGFKLDNWDIRNSPEYRDYGIADEMSDFDVMLIVGNIYDNPELMSEVLREDT